MSRSESTAKSATGTSTTSSSSCRSRSGFPEDVGPPRGSRIRHLVTLPDLLPTLDAALDLPLTDADREQLAGVDALARRSRRDRALAQHPTRRRRAEVERLGEAERFALVRLDWKLAWSPNGREELYRMADDREENENRILRDPDTAAELRDELLEEIARLSGDGTDFAVLDETAPEVLEQLQALGYLD